MVERGSAEFSASELFHDKGQKVTDQRVDFNLVTSGGRNNQWYRTHRQQILNAAMGKGSHGIMNWLSNGR